MTTIRVGHLYPEYLNIYADRGNIAVLTRRAALRGHDLVVEGVSIGDALEPGSHDLLYVGGGQDREQELISPTSPDGRMRSGMRSTAARRSSPSAAAISSSGAATGSGAARSARRRPLRCTRRSRASGG